MKFNFCLLVTLCLLFAGCNKSEQTKSEDSNQPPPGNTPAMGQFGQGPSPGGGFGGPSGGRGGPGGGGRAGGGNFDPAAMFNAMDADGDGKLTGDEIPDRWKDNLDAMDTDKDGSITLEEQQAWLQKFMAEGGFGRGPGGGPGGGGDFRGFGADPRNSEEYKSGKHRPELDE